MLTFEMKNKHTLQSPLKQKIIKKQGKGFLLNWSPKSTAHRTKYMGSKHLLPTAL